MYKMIFCLKLHPKAQRPPDVIQGPSVKKEMQSIQIILMSKRVLFSGIIIA